MAEEETTVDTVTFINLFEVPEGSDELFLAKWREVNTYMRDKPGYVDHRLHRALRSDTRYRYVNVVHWADAAAWQAAHDDGFRALVQQPEWAEFTSTPGLFEPIDEFPG
jgi:heme-degrading monooxygenase HmoA